MGDVCTGFAGAVSRSATAPVDRLKMLLMVEETPQAKGLRWGFHRMAAEGETVLLLLLLVQGNGKFGRFGGWKGVDCE